MTGTPLQGVDVVSPQHVHRDGGPPGRMAGDELPLRHVPGDHPALLPLLDPDGLVQADVLHQDVQVVVVVPDVTGERCPVVVGFQDAVGRLRVDGVPVQIHAGEVAGLLLRDPEQVPLEAGRLDPDHVAVALVQIT